jgi:hypothetical protein
MKGFIRERNYTRKELYLHEECRNQESVRELVDWWGQAKITQKQRGFEPWILKFIAKRIFIILEIISEISTLNLQPFLEGSATLNELIFVNS